MKDTTGFIDTTGLPRHVLIALCEMALRELDRIDAILDAMLPKATGDI